MSKKEGKKVSLFEEMHFEDAAYAQAVIILMVHRCTMT